ncbi:2-hydroxyacid dehydrogenase [Paeniglutamicibacter gangotriensis]|uniref:2-hydroxyacid dehydrogenase n=1 Tax=Paeniglutamicibacter gangotriensis TaxID=254787 RepID=UPI0037CB1ACD
MSTSHEKPHIVYVDANASSLTQFRSLGLLERLGSIGVLTVHNGTPESAADYVSMVGSAQVVIVGGTLPDEVLSSAPRLALVAYVGQGASNFINLRLAQDRGIHVANTPEYGNSAVAEHVIALLFSVARRTPQGDRHVRAGLWRPFPSGMEISGKTAGLIGYGGIGSHVAKLLGALGMKVLAWNRTPVIDEDSNVEFSSLPEIFERSDMVSLHLALNEQTHGFITGELLDRLRPGAMVINTARSELIEKFALEDRLEKGLLSAGLDVFGQEPPERNDRLLSLENVVLTPHQGYNTPQAFSAMATMVVENIENFLQGKDFHRTSL